MGKRWNRHGKMRRKSNRREEGNGSGEGARKRRRNGKEEKQM
jgi:hypothetical protein